MYRLVVDTNVFISAVTNTGKRYQFLLEAVLGGKCTLVTSDEIIREIRAVLGRRNSAWTKTTSTGRCPWLESLSEVIETKSKFRVVNRDPNDDMFINAAYDGSADYIVSGDCDLLDLKEWKGIKVVSATKCWRSYSRMAERASRLLQDEVRIGFATKPGLGDIRRMRTALQEKKAGTVIPLHNTPACRKSRSHPDCSQDRTPDRRHER